MMYFCGCWGLSVKMNTGNVLKQLHICFTCARLPSSYRFCSLLTSTSCKKRKKKRRITMLLSEVIKPSLLHIQYIKLVWSSLHVCHYTWMLLRLLPSATSSLHNSLILEVEELYSQEKKVTFHVCRLCFFLTNHKRKTGTNLLFFHTLFTENNADLAVTQ